MLVGSVGQLLRGAEVSGEPVVYLGGAFNGANSVHTSTRNYAAAVDADVTANTAAMVRAWNPDCNNSVQCMALNGSDIYLGGWFTSARGETRNRAACVESDPDSATPSLRNWHPDCNSYVTTLVLNGVDMYLGGAFTIVGGLTRNGAACVSSSTSLATLRDWHPNCNSRVEAMVLNGVDMYLGGAFTTVRGSTRNRAACVASDPSAANPDLRSWNPNCNNQVKVMLLKDWHMYLGGSFTTVRGQSRPRAACVDSNPGQANPNLREWDPTPNNSFVYALALNDPFMYLGGDFTFIQSTGRSRAACVYSAQEDFDIRNWNPFLNGTVHSLILNGDDMYLAGAFTTISGDNARGRAACADSNPGTQASFRAWNPVCSGIVYVMALSE